MARKKQFDYFGELNQLATNAYEAAKVLQEIVDNYSLENLVKKELTAYIVKATEGVKSATKEFAKFKNSKTLVSLIDEVNTIESQGDKLYSSAMKDLMTNEKDLLKVIKWKDVYDQLERTINDCEAAVNIIVGIVIKNT